MLRVNPAIAENVQIDKFGSGKGGFQGGSPTTGEKATQVPAVWLDHIQEELARVIEGAGIALDGAKYDQLLSAIKIITLNKQGDDMSGVLRAKSGMGANAGIKSDTDQDTGWEWPSDGVLQAIVNSVKRVEMNANTGATSLWTHNGYRLVLQSDGNLVWYNASNVLVWSALGSAPLASPALTGKPTAPTAATGTRSTQLATTAFVGAESQIAAPVGSVYTFAGATVPTGWLKCNGALLSRTTYAALFAVIGTTYGAGDGSTTFALPDLRGEFVRGFDDARKVDTGRALGSAQAGQNASHTHTASTSPAGGHHHVFENLARQNDTDRGAGNASLWSIDNTATQTTSAVGDHIHAITVAASGGNESRPRNVAMHYIIKY